MSSIKWIKITTNVFDDEKIRLIETLPDADTILVIWFKLLSMAGKCNDSGLVYLARDIPYTDEMLSTLLRRPINTIRLALQEFVNLKMIEIHNDFIAIVNWEKHQNIEKLDMMKEISRNSSKKYREKQKELCNKIDRDVTVTESDRIDKNRIDKNRIDKNRIDKNRIDKNRIDKNRIDKKLYPKIQELTQFLYDNIKQNSNPPKWQNNTPKLDKWIDDIEKLNRIDGIEIDQIKKVIIWSTKNQFWKSNILSGNSLRKNFDRLYIQMNNKQTNTKQQFEGNSKDNIDKYLRGKL